ncbi:hypothetical protein C8J57DRAFT_1126173 [Mycena rebaudengoi]|nr:hypothetical protein C8J57DRAFT_1126173 [Mycena rebaudengoi]
MTRTRRAAPSTFSSGQRSLLLKSRAYFHCNRQEFKASLSTSWHDSFTPLTIRILRAFTPFTSAVVLLAEALDCPAHLKLLPKQFVLKLSDRRFGCRDPVQPQLLWRPEIEFPLRRGMQRMVGTDRSRPILQMYYRRKYLRPEEDPEGPLPEWDGWELELYIWTVKQRSYLAETLAYRHLQALQGSCIPTLHGTIRVPISPSTAFVHPIVDFIPGLALEYIASPHMGELEVGVDITKGVGELISQRLIDSVTQIRNSYCRHNDIHLANVVLGNWPESPQPVIIDFGLSSVIPPGTPTAKWVSNVDEVLEVRQMLTDPENGDWHIGSPYQQRVYEKLAQHRGYAYVNNRIEAIPEDVRNIQFERVPGSEAFEARERMLLWRVRPGVRTQDDYLAREGKRY